MKQMKKSNTFANYVWALRELISFKKSYLILLSLNAILRGFTPVLVLLLFQRLIDMLQYGTHNAEEAVILLIAISVLALLSEVILINTDIKINNQELKFELYFQKKILSKVSELSCKDFENNRTYDLVNRAQYDAEAGITGVIKESFALISSLIGTVSYIVIIAKFNLLLLLIIMCMPVIRYIFEKKYNLLEYKTEIENTEPNRKAGYITYLLTNSENFKEIKTFGLFDFFIKRYSEVKELCNIKLIDLNNRRGRIFTALTVVDQLIDLAVTLMILLQTCSGTLSVGRFLLYNNSIDNLKDNIISAFTQLSGIYKNCAMIEQIRKLLDMQSEELQNDGVIIDKVSTIKLERVSYKYRGKEDYALKNIDFKIKAGEMNVLMGSNGSGKSTLVKIIMGVYTDYIGKVLVNGVDLKEINLTEYRKKVSSLFQNYIKYESTIEDNISFGDIHKTKERAQIVKILNEVNLAEYEDHLSDKLGYQFEDGTQISVGQWQKLALGRSLYRNADIYVFDEPNASLDLKTESEILKTISKESKGSISILIVHRFNNLVEKADRISFLENGEITAVGTHKELLKEYEPYSKLYNQYHNISDQEINGIRTTMETV